MRRLTKDHFLTFEKWAEDCLKAKCHLGSVEAFTLIAAIAHEAAHRGQRNNGRRSLKAECGGAREKQGPEVQVQIPPLTP
jgi:hypothetical protein